MIFVECNTDEFLVVALGVSRRKIRHESGKSRVVARVEQHEDAISLHALDIRKIRKYQSFVKRIAETNDDEIAALKKWISSGHRGAGSAQT